MKQSLPSRSWWLVQDNSQQLVAVLGSRCYGSICEFGLGGGWEEGV